MPTVFKASLDGSNAVRYFHFPLAEFYLGQAHDYAIKSMEEHKEGHLAASSVISIVFSAMALEAFANGISEDFISDDELDHFNHLRNMYKRKRKESSLAAKIRILFEKKFSKLLDSELRRNLEELIYLRNNLTHYRLGKSAGRYIMPPVKTIDFGNGQKMTTIDFTSKPEKIEPPFLLKVNAEATVKCFNTALLIINTWNALLDSEKPGFGSE